MVPIEGMPYCLDIGKEEFCELVVNSKKTVLWVLKPNRGPGIELIDLRSIPRLPRTIHKRLDRFYEHFCGEKPSRGEKAEGTCQ